MPATLAPVDLEASFRRGKYAIAAITLMAKQCRDALAAGGDISDVPGRIWDDRDLVASEIAAGEPARRGETAMDAYARALPVVEEAVDAAFLMLFPAAGV